MKYLVSLISILALGVAATGCSSLPTDSDMAAPYVRSGGGGGGVDATSQYYGALRPAPVQGAPTAPLGPYGGKR
jgi:hypothetical protein